MAGWLVNDKLTCIPGTRTLWHALLSGIDGLQDMTSGDYSTLVESVRRASVSVKPDYIIRNGTYFQSLEIDVPTITFIQDIQYGSARDTQIKVGLESSLIVWNSEYTRAMFPELIGVPSRTIPVGTDFGLFKLGNAPVPSEPVVLYVGSSAYVKGWDLLLEIAVKSGLRFVFVLKDSASVSLPNVEVFRRIDQKRLSEIASGCSVGICTSVMETQHLAGIEMGACGLPIVATPVGIYWGRERGVWGCTLSAGSLAKEWEYELRRTCLAPQSERRNVREYWMRQGLDMPTCIESWKNAVESVLGVSAHA